MAESVVSITQLVHIYVSSVNNTEKINELNNYLAKPVVQAKS